jgi:hypothetical protein
MHIVDSLNVRRHYKLLAAQVLDPSLANDLDAARYHIALERAVYVLVDSNRRHRYCMYGPVAAGLSVPLVDTGAAVEVRLV